MCRLFIFYFFLFFSFSLFFRSNGISKEFGLYLWSECFCIYILSYIPLELIVISDKRLLKPPPYFMSMYTLYNVYYTIPSEWILCHLLFQFFLLLFFLSPLSFLFLFVCVKENDRDGDTENVFVYTFSLFRFHICLLIGSAPCYMYRDIKLTILRVHNTVSRSHFLCSSPSPSLASLTAVFYCCSI